MAGRHFVNIKYPISKNPFFLWAKAINSPWRGCSKFDFYYGDVNGVPLPDDSYMITSTSREYMSTGSYFDKYRNKPCTHSSIDGTVLLLPTNASEYVKLTYGSDSDGDKLFLNGSRSICTMQNSVTKMTWGTYTVQTDYTSSVEISFETGGRTTRNEEKLITNSLYSARGPMRAIWNVRSYVVGSQNPSWSEVGTNYKYVCLSPPLSSASFSISPEVLHELLRVSSASPLSISPSDNDKMMDQLYRTLEIPAVNNIQNLLDLKNVKKQVAGAALSLTKLANATSVKKMVNPLGQLFLAKKYGLDNTKRDLETHLSWLENYLKSPTKDYVQNVVTTSHDEVGYANSVIATVDRWHFYRQSYASSISEKLGLQFNLANIWDTVPFSFVVDWISDVGTILTKIDRQDVLSLSVKYLSMYSSQSVQKRGLCHTDRYQFTYVANYYSRSKMEFLPSYSFVQPNPSPAQHAWEGIALLLNFVKIR